MWLSWGGKRTGESHMWGLRGPGGKELDTVMGQCPCGQGRGSIPHRPAALPSSSRWWDNPVASPAPPACPPLVRW